LIYKSSKSQIDIILKTIKYIKKYKKMPSVADIDENAQRVKISSFQYIYYLKKNKDNNYKIFFSHSKLIYNFFGLHDYNPLAIVYNKSEKPIDFNHKYKDSNEYLKLYKDKNMKEIRDKTRTILKYINMFYNELPNKNKL
jgi:hypothetical protein